MMHEGLSRLAELIGVMRKCEPEGVFQRCNFVSGTILAEGIYQFDKQAFGGIGTGDR